MEPKKIETYIQKLIELDKSLETDSPELGDGVDLSDDFINKLNDVLSSLGKDIETDMKKKVELPLTLSVKFKKIHPKAVTPAYAKDGDAGLDLTATEIYSNTTFQVEYGTGITIEIPRGYVGLLFPRSSVRKYELFLSNCVGVIDSGYRGEICLTFNKSDGLDSFKYKPGDKIGQLVILPFPLIQLIESEALSESERNTQGYGSSGE